MASSHDAPTLNMGAVIRQTGLSEHTLRAWERRYGLPQPHRTAGGHRLYSQRDVELLKWLLLQQQAGLTISQAVARWRQLEAAGQDPLRQAPVLGPATAAPAPQLQALRDSWLAACLAFDERAAEAILTQAFALYPAETVCTDLIQAGLAAVGEGWYRGEISVQQEHFISALSTRRLQALIAGAPAPWRTQRLLIGCAPDEEHAFGPLLLTLLLRLRGWPVLFLGARVPVEGLDTTVAETRPDLVVLTADRLPAAAALAEAARVVHNLAVAVAYGGQVFNRLPQVRQRIPAHFLGERIPDAVQTVERLLAQPAPRPPLAEPVASYADALAQLRERLSVIEAEVHDRMTQRGMAVTQIHLANAYLSQHLLGALALGDLSVLETELAWVTGLLVQRGLTPALIQDYLTTYYQAALHHLDRRAQPLLEWLRNHAGPAAEHQR